MSRPAKTVHIVGAREWVRLPDLGLPAVVAKMDTGAKTATLHARDLDVDGERIAFTAILGDDERRADAPLKEWRWVTDSGGHQTLRPVIETTFHLGPLSWREELTLFERLSLKHRLLLGRRCLAGRFVVDPGAACLWPMGA